MAFCHECGSEVTENDAFCPICGIAQRSPVLEEAAADDASVTDGTSETADMPQRSADGSGASSESVPGDEFVDISALRTEEPAISGEPPAAEPVREVPEDEFVDISALSSEAADEDAGVSEPASLAEVPEDEFVEISALGSEGLDESAAAEEPDAEPEEEASVPEPPAPAILAGSSDQTAEIEEQPDEISAVTEEEALPDEHAIDLQEEPVSVTDADAEPSVAPGAETGKRPEVRAVSDWETTGTRSASDGESSPEGEADSLPSEESVEEQSPVAERLVPQPYKEPAAVPEAELSAGEQPEATPVEESEEEPDFGAPEATSSAAVEVPDVPTTDTAEEEESAQDDSPAFLEDATLIAMPHMDIPELAGMPKAEPVAEPPTQKSIDADDDEEAEPTLEQPVEEEEPEAASTEPETEQPASAESVEGEAVSEPAGFDGAAVAAARSGSGKVDEPPHTTPNIGGGDTDGSRAPKLQPLTEGTVLNGRYEIVRKIGGGGMGAVYLASDKNLGGVLRAVKEMVQSYIEEAQQDKAVQDFKRESMLLTSLEHPSIPTIYDYFFDETAHRFYLVMKYISGGDLAARLRAAPEGKLEEREVTEWAIQIADVLDYLHNRQPPIVYRDLKPANVMLDGNSGKVMLIDFGIARWINKEEKGVTAVGTMGYAPPELFSGNVVPSSDIYSLGSTVFHLLTGADPQNNPLLIFDFEKNPRPRQINPRLSDQIEGILMKSVEYNAEKRFISAGEMRDALTEHLANLNAGNVTYGKTESPKSIGFSDQTVFCGFCGQKIVATDMFCAFCGAKQPLAQPGVHSREHIPVRLTAKLIIEGTSQLDYPSFELAKDENLVGRRDPMSNIFPEVDLSKFDPQTKISRKHARIFREGDRYMLEDLGSSNGTVLIPSTNESLRLAPHQAQALSHGDRIKLGDTMLHFVIGG